MPTPAFAVSVGVHVLGAFWAVLVGDLVSLVLVEDGLGFNLSARSFSFSSYSSGFVL